MPVAHRFASCQNGQKMHPHPILLPVGEGPPVTCCEVAWCARHRASFLSHFSPIGRDGRAAPVRAKVRVWERTACRAVALANSDPFLPQQVFTEANEGNKGS